MDRRAAPCRRPAHRDRDARLGTPAPRRPAFGKTIDIMMAVALGMGDADEGDQRHILLHGKARLAGEVFAGNEECSRLPRSISPRACH